ncbi:MAG: hypothetical protein SF339_25015 [Blastocatellia bacterium]|nr:hypothetical protein [Blastocatellia bacterium]
MKSSPLAGARQLVLVTAADWNAVDGEMRRYERATDRSAWREVGTPIPIVVGRNGMAWGRGLHGEAFPPGGNGPVKKEGDGRAPAGIFSLGAAFGYASRSSAGNLQLPYVQAVETLECVDDMKSAHYNQVLDRRSVKTPDWQSSELMRRQDDLYRLGVIVDHNADRVAGCGSCIFLHIWSGAGKGTAGCTAMEAPRLSAVVEWLDAKKQPRLVQLPKAEFRQFQQSWRLPAIGDRP